jgi:hypothetical protein
MRYTLPEDVTSPQDAISKVEVIHDDGEDSVSIARITWFGTEMLAMRWNIALREWDDPEKIDESKICLGMPVSRGYPTWFILPEKMFDFGSELSYIFKKLSK